MESATQVKPVQALSLTPFLQLAKDSIVDGVDAVMKKGCSIRFDADYTNAIVDVLAQKEQFKAYSKVEIKLAIGFWLKASVYNQIAHELKITAD